MRRWTASINPVILARGREYVDEGRVLSVVHSEDGVYRAQVQGEARYRVAVSLDADGHLYLADCTCPYDGGVCKHIAAVLLTQEGDEGRRPAYYGYGSDLRPLRDQLQKLPPNQLIDLLMALAAESQAVAERLNFTVTDGSENEVAAARRLIRQHVADASDPDGFVGWREVGSATAGGETVLEHARGIEGWRRVLPLCLCVFEEMVDLIQEADDSDGTIGGVIESSLELIATTVDNAPEADYEEIFGTLMAAADNEHLDGWEWRMDLWELALLCAATDDVKARWDERVAYAAAPSNRSFGNYDQERIRELQYEWLLERKDSTAADVFLRQHLAVPALRKTAIELALKESRWQDAMVLAEEGEMLNRNLPGLVTQWRQLRYQAAKRAGRTDVQQAVALQQVKDGDFSYYRKLKSLYRAAEWKAVYEELLGSLGHEDWQRAQAYTQILIEEGETAKLLAYVQRFPSTIDDYHPYLMDAYHDETARLFHRRISTLAAHAASRAHYQHVCALIRTMAQGGAHQEAVQLIDELRAAYPRKRAFQEELVGTRRRLG